MAAEQRLSQVLTKKLGFYVPISEIGYETIWFMKEEVDETLVSPHIIEHLVEPIIQTVLVTLMPMAITI